MKKTLLAFAVVALFIVGGVPASVHAASMTATSAQIAPYAASLSTASACQQPDRTRDTNTLSVSERMAQGYPLPMKGIDTTAMDRTYQQNGTHVCTAASTNNKGPGADYEQNNPKWAGNVAYQRNSSNGLYTGVYGTWTVSCIPNGTNDDYYTWLGLGGVNNGNLVQTGTRGTNRGTGAQYYAWFENTADSGNPYTQDAFRVRCGDSMYAEADAPNYMYIHDETSNLSYSTNFGPATNETTAECIVERPDINESPAFGLSRFGVETFNSCLVNSTGWGYFQGIDNAYHYYFNLTNGSGKLLASVGPITNNVLGTFSITWHAYN